MEYLKTFVEEKGKRKAWLLGHSVGGAISMLFTARYPEKESGVINVEGNFTLADAFWSQKIAEAPPEVWFAEFAEIKSDPERWLKDSGIVPTEERIRWATAILDYQPAQTVQSMAKAVVAETRSSEFLAKISDVFEAQIPVVLLAGEKSLEGWHVPDLIIDKTGEIIIQKNVGHMMMIEDPNAFCQIVGKVLENLA